MGRDAFWFQESPPTPRAGRGAGRLWARAERLPVAAQVSRGSAGRGRSAPPSQRAAELRLPGRDWRIGAHGADSLLDRPAGRQVRQRRARPCPGESAASSSLPELRLAESPVPKPPELGYLSAPTRQRGCPERGERIAQRVPSGATQSQTSVPSLGRAGAPAQQVRAGLLRSELLFRLRRGARRAGLTSSRHRTRSLIGVSHAEAWRAPPRRSQPQ